MWGGFQGCTLAQGEDVEVGAGEMWPGQWGDKLCVHSVASSVSQGRVGQDTFERYDGEIDGIFED